MWAVFHFIKPLQRVRDVDRARRRDRGGRRSCTSTSRPSATSHRSRTRCRPSYYRISTPSPGCSAAGSPSRWSALAQAAGIAAAVPNPDGSRSNTSGDFVAQGAANLAGGFFGALPTGGSLSRTGVAVSAGAQTRWAGIFAGVWLTLLVLVAGSLAEVIPMPVIGGLILVIGVELVAGRCGGHHAGAADRAAVGGGHGRHLPRDHRTAAAPGDPDRGDHLAGALLREGVAVGHAGRASPRPATAAGIGPPCPTPARATR